MMKKFVLMFLAIALFFSQCGPKNSQEDESQSEDSITSTMEAEIDALAIEEELTEDEKVRNMYKNTSAIAFNVLVVSFDQIFKDEAKTLTASISSLSTEASDEEVAAVDSKIEDFSDDFKNKLDSGLVAMEDYFDKLKSENEEVYNQIFDRETMKAGISIADNYQLPKGFKPLHQNLDQHEVTRYVVRLVANSNDNTDPLNQYMTEVMQWFNQVSNELDADPEISTYIESLKEKQ